MFYYLEIFQEIGDKQNGKQKFILVHFFCFVEIMHMHVMCWNYEHGTMDDHKMKCNACLCLVGHLFTWYANEMYVCL